MLAGEFEARELLLLEELVGVARDANMRRSIPLYTFFTKIARATPEVVQLFHCRYHENHPLSLEYH
jgi:hypothetical protein